MKYFIVVVPANHPRLFLASHHSHAHTAWSAEYPSAFQFISVRDADKAAKMVRGMVYSNEGYENGTGPERNHTEAAA